MVHGKGDTNHGAANPPSSKERAQRNPSARITAPPATALSTGEHEGNQPCSQQKPGHILRSRSHQPGKGPGQSPHTPQPLLSGGLGAELAPSTAPWGWATQARTDRKGGQQGLILPAAVLAALLFPACCRGVPSAPPRKGRRLERD